LEYGADGSHYRPRLEVGWAGPWVRLSLKWNISRLFVAITLPDPIRTTLVNLQRELKPILPSSSTAWTRPENLHLTLRFLGNVASMRIPELAKQLDLTLAGFGEFHVGCKQLGCFPDVRFPRVVWVGVSDAEARLIRLQRLVNETVVGFAQTPAEATFVGHITLARFKHVQRPEAERLAHFVERAATRHFGGWQVSSIALIRSQPSPAGADYTEIFCTKLP
jgi:2'-5' RNA ligase